MTEWKLVLTSQRVYIFHATPALIHHRSLASSKSVPLDAGAPKKDVGRGKKRYPMTPQDGEHKINFKLVCIDLHCHAAPNCVMIDVSV